MEEVTRMQAGKAHDKVEGKNINKVYVLLIIKCLVVEK
jgi:hypothetical protein